MSDVVYNVGKNKIGTDAFAGDDLRALILAGTSSPASNGANGLDLDTVADILALTNVDESVATNYARVSLAGVTITTDDTNDWAVLDCDDIVFADLGEPDGSDDPARALVIYKHVAGGDANCIPISFHDSGFPVGLNGQDLTVATPDGFIRLREP